jgi:hypothetical protein
MPVAGVELIGWWELAGPKADAERRVVLDPRDRLNPRLTRPVMYCWRRSFGRWTANSTSTRRIASI